VSPAAGQLSGLVAAVRGHLRRRAARAVALWVAAGGTLVLLGAWVVVGDGWRQGSNVPLLIDVLLVVWVAAGVAAFRVGARRWFHDVPLARSIERAAGMEPGLVRGSLELAQAVPSGVSGALVERAVAGTASRLAGRAPDELAGDLGRHVALWTRRGMIAAVVSVVALVSLGVASPERTAHAWAGVSSPFRTMLDPGLEPIVVTPGTVEVMRGADVRLEVEAGGRLEVELLWQAAGDVARSARLELLGGRAGHVFEAVTATIEYRVRAADGASTETYRIVPIDPLFVSELIVGVEYPPHTGLEQDEYRGDPPPLRLPVGSRLTFEGLASRRLSRAGLVDSLGRPALDFDVDGPAFAGEWAASRSGTFAWVFLDVGGVSAEIGPEPLELLVVPDSAPRVSILLPGQDTVLPLSLRQPLVVDVRDDYGLARFELVAYRVTAFGERHEPVVQGLDVGGVRAALARPALDLSRWELLPGDTVRYFARAIDNHPSAQVGVSHEYALRMPDVVELRREAEQTLASVAERLEELRAQVARQAEANADRAAQAAAQQSRQSAADAQAGFEQREALRRALEEQAALLAQVDSLRVGVEALERALQNAGQSDPALARDLERLQRLLEKLAADSLLERMEELSEAMQRGDRSAGNRSLQQLSREQDGLGERLEQVLEAFQRAAVEQDFRATTSEASQLARHERALADALREADDPSLRAEQQAALVERAEELEARMSSLAERLADLGEPRAAAGVEEARERAEQARQRMQQAERRAQQGDSQGASQQAQQAADRMQQAASQMQQAQDRMAEQTLAAAQAALQQAADDALALARRQAALRERMENASPERLGEMRGDQGSLLRGLENLAGDVQAGTQATGGDPALSAQMGRAMEAMQGAIQAMDGRNPSPSQAASRAERALAELNQLALMAMASAAQAGSIGAGQSGQDIAEQIGQLAQRQGDLLARTGQLPPMRLGEQALAQQLGDLAQQQGGVARDIDDLARSPGADDALGDLEQLAREAELLADQLAQGRLTPDIVRRQERLFHRLLDAGRSLEQEEFSEERESETPGIFERADVVPLTPEHLGVLRFELPDAGTLRQLSPAVRQLVLEYFERLNRAPARQVPR
jgi:hypothetical protein